MHKRMRQLVTLCIVVLVMLAACQSEGAATTPTAVVPTAPPSPSMISRVDVSSITPEPMPLPTATPGFLLSPAQYLPSPFSGAVPLGALARLGQGTLYLVRPSPDGKYLAVGGSMGVTVYETENYEQVWFGRTSAEVLEFGWSPDGKRIAAGLGGGAIVIWDSSNGARILKIGDGGSQSLAWVPDGSQLLAMGQDGIARIWDAATGVQLYHLDPSRVYADGIPSRGIGYAFAEISPDGRLVATTYIIGGGETAQYDEKIAIWNAKTGEYLKTLLGPAYVSIAWSPDSQLIASSGGDEVVIWDVEAAAITRKLTLDGLDMSSIESMLWSPDGKWIVVSDYQDAVIFGAEHGTPMFLSETRERFVGWNPNSSRYATLQDATLVVSSILNGMELGRIASVSDAAAFSPDWTTFYGWIGTRDSTLVYSWPELANSTLGAWNIETGTQRKIITTGTRWVQSIAWSPDGSRLATGSADYTGSAVVIWDAQTGEALHSFSLWPDGQEVKTQVAWSPDGSTLAVGTEGFKQYSGTGGVILLQADLGQELGTLETGRVDSLAWSPDGSMIAIGGEYACLSVWDAYSGRQLQRLEGHLPDHWGTCSVFDVDWSPNGKIASAGSDGQVILWDASTGTLIKNLNAAVPEVSSVAFSPDGSLLAVASVEDYDVGATVTVWNVEAGRAILTLEGVKRDDWFWYGITSVGWSPDGSKLAAAYGFPHEEMFGNGFSPDGSSVVVVWDVATGQLLHEFEGHTSDVQSLAFSPDGARLASGSLDGTVILWDVSQ